MASLGRRLGFLDGLRAVAVLAVLWEHASGEARAPYLDLTRNWRINIGQFGVTVFFLISGFIIPQSLENGRSVGTFWVKRLFRLYPLLWFSLVAAAAVHSLGYFGLPSNFGWYGWAANASMVPGWLHERTPIGPLWTLSYELLFYAACSILWLLKVRRTDLLLIGISLVAMIHSVLVFRSGTPLALGAFHFTAMFCGTVVYRVMNGSLSRSQGLASVGIASTARLVATAVSGSGAARDTAISLGTAAALAYCLFLTVSWLRPRFHPAILKVGVVSYSIYLIHTPLLALVHATRLEGPTYIALGASLTVGVSILTYRFVERPGILLGRRLTSRWTSISRERAAVTAARGET